MEKNETPSSSSEPPKAPMYFDRTTEGYYDLLADAEKLIFDLCGFEYRIHHGVTTITNHKTRLSLLETEINLMKNNLEDETIEGEEKKRNKLKKNLVKRDLMKDRLKILEESHKISVARLYICEIQLDAYRELGIIPKMYGSRAKNTVREE